MSDQNQAPAVSQAMREAVARYNPAPPPIPVRDAYYITECEHCGWVGSSEQCGGGIEGDDDIICPVCCTSMCGDAPSEADTAKHGQAVFDRIEGQASEIARLTEKRDDALGAAALNLAQLKNWRRQAEAAEAETARLRAALAEARAEGRRQGLEEANDLAQCLTDAIEDLRTVREIHKDSICTDRYEATLAAFLATITPETQKPETGESDR